jgi:hypothetical protein
MIYGQLNKKAYTVCDPRKQITMNNFPETGGSFSSSIKCLVMNTYPFYPYSPPPNFIAERRRDEFDSK